MLRRCDYPYKDGAVVHWLVWGALNIPCKKTNKNVFHLSCSIMNAFNMPVDVATFFTAHQRDWYGKIKKKNRATINQKSVWIFKSINQYSVWLAEYFLESSLHHVNAMYVCCHRVAILTWNMPESCLSIKISETKEDTVQPATEIWWWSRY